MVEVNRIFWSINWFDKRIFPEFFPANPLSFLRICKLNPHGKDRELEKRRRREEREREKKEELSPEASVRYRAVYWNLVKKRKGGKKKENTKVCSLPSKRKLRKWIRIYFNDVKLIITPDNRYRFQIVSNRYRDR